MSALAIIPSAEARRLYGRMAARADDNGIVSIEKSVTLGIDLLRAGEEAGVVAELLEQKWVSLHPGGGWDVHL